MVQSVRKFFGLYLIFAAAVLLVCTGGPAAAESQPADKTLQPQALDYVGVYALRRTEPNLTGSGVKFAVISRSITYIDGEPQNDYYPGTEHSCFAGKDFDFHDQDKMPEDISAHSTAICSILFGEDPNASARGVGEFHYQGVAPQAQADIYEFQHFLIDNIFALRPPDADVLTISVGSQFEDWWTRGIESLAEHYGLIIVAGIGNGSDAYDPALYPAAAANVIGVGVVDSVRADELTEALANFSLVYPEHSSLGPASDGRSKPDIVAPGNCLAAGADDPCGYEPTGNYSSFSTPIVAGTVGLLVQKAKEEPNLGLAVSPAGGNCVIKAILLNSAMKLPYWHKGQLRLDDDSTSPLDYLQGAGMLNAVGAYEHLIAGRGEPGDAARTGWDLNLLQKDDGAQNIYKITVEEPQGKFITATAVWNRHYSRVYPFESVPQKDADLRLELWAVDANDPNDRYLLDYSDSKADNLEHIYHPADTNYNSYEIVLSCSDTNDANHTALAQRYGLAWDVSAKVQNDSIFWYDLNSDGIVNDSDFTILLNNLLSSAKGSADYLVGDINGDGVIGVEDFKTLLDHTNLKARWYNSGNL